MDKPSFTIRIYSVYLFLLGAGLMVWPTILLSFFGFPETKEIWIRMLGLFTFTVGIYYFYSSAHKQIAFYKATVIGRVFFFLMTLGFVFLFHQPFVLALIGGMDLLGALWTQFTLKESE